MYFAFLANIMNDHPREPLYNPIEGNVFIDCRQILKIAQVFDISGDGTAPGLASRIAPIRDNVVIYTCGTNELQRVEIDQNVSSGFRVIDRSRGN